MNDAEPLEDLSVKLKTTVRKNGKVKLKAVVSGGVGKLKYQFSMGDGSEYSGKTSKVKHVYKGRGEYKVKVVVTDQTGVKAEAKDKVQIDY